MANNDVNNQNKLHNTFNICRYIAVVLGMIFLSNSTVKSAPLVNSTKVLQQNLYKEITGIVKTQNGDPIPGAVVLKLGTNQGAETDTEGRYSLNANEGDKIQFVYEGFKTTTITVRTGNIFNITMVEDDTVELLHVEISCCYPSSFSKVQIPPHGTMAINYKTIEGEPRAKTVTSIPKIGCGYSRRCSFAQILKPFIPTITYTPEINRNAETILKDVEALTRNGKYTYVVDGVRVSEETFRSLNQNDVESVDIYKHTDVYNARFGNKENQSRIVLQAK